MIESHRNIVVLGILIFVTLILPGCKSANTTLKNGIVKTQLSGNVDTTQDFKISLPAGVQVLMVQSSANDQIQLQLLDASKNPLPDCAQATFCRLSAPVAGDYYVRITALGAFNGVSLVASWSGGGTATLQNGVPLSGLAGNAGSVILESLSIPFYYGNLNLSATANGAFSMELLDAAGAVLQRCDDVANCNLKQQFAGAYFVRVTATDDLPDLSVQASWGGADQATMTNGVPLKGLSGTADSDQLEAVYLQEGTEAMMVQVSGTTVPVYIDILDENGNREAGCTTTCVLSMPAPGLHYIQLHYVDNVSAMSVTAIWGGQNQSFLQNGVQQKGLSGNARDILLTSVYIPDDNTTLALQTSSGAQVTLNLIDANGNSVWTNAGNGYGRTVFAQNLQSGLYFIQMVPQADNVFFSLTAAWGGNGKGVLHNGVPLTGLSGSENDILLTSIYIPGDNATMMLRVTEGVDVSLQLLDVNGNSVWNGGGSSYAATPIPNLPAGVYFVQMAVNYGNVAFSLTGAWGGNANGILQNGVPLAELSGNQNDVRLASIYIPNDFTTLMLNTSGAVPVSLSLIDADGNIVWSNNGFGSAPIKNLLSGVYFVQMVVQGDNASFSLSAAWGSSGEGVLQNGVPLTGLSGNQYDTLLQSVYVPDNVQSLQLTASPAVPVQFALVDEAGTTYVPAGSDGVISIPGPGLYFVSTYLGADVQDFSLTASW